MHVRRLTAEQQRTSVRVAILALQILGLAGCAFEFAQRPSSPATEAPYVGVFTGEFVDGLPLYRFPTIEVIGSRRSVIHDLSDPGGG